MNKFYRSAFLAISFICGSSTNNPVFAQNNQPDAEVVFQKAILPGDIPPIALNSRVHQVVASNGKVYIGGRFINAAGIDAADYIVMWDGTKWNALGSGLNNRVYGIAVNGNDVYAAGIFTNAGGIEAADYVARWDGEKWNALGAAGMGGSVQGLFQVATFGSNVFVAGLFTNAAGIAEADNMARFDGTNWHALGTGLNTSPEVLAFDAEGNLFAGGSFTNAGGIAEADYIAKWNGNAWNALGTGTTGAVYGITFSGSDMYIGGSFGVAGGVENTRYIARWDGTKWNPVGNGFTGTATIRAIQIDGNRVIAGGSFSDAFGNPVSDNIVQFEGGSWKPLEYGLNGAVNWMAKIGDFICLGGEFSNAFGDPGAVSFTTWSSKKPYWKSFGKGFNNMVNVVKYHNGKVYAGGEFQNAGGDETADNIAVWDGTAWKGIGGGLNAGVLDIAFSGDKVFVAGYFTDAGGNENADKITFWDGEKWNPLDKGFNQDVNPVVLFVDGNDVYAGGTFGSINDDASLRGFARWDGTKWNSVGGGVGAGTGTGVGGIAKIGNDFYVNGNFDRVGNAVGGWDRFAKWDGASWSKLPKPPFTTLPGKPVIFNDSLFVYIGQAMLKLNGAKWDTVLNVTGLGSTDRGAFGVHDGALYAVVVNPVTSPTQSFRHRLMRRNGKFWEETASGASLNAVRSFDSTPNGILLAGAIFDFAGNPDADSIVLWGTSTQFGSTTSVETTSEPGVFALEQNYPNPFNPSTTIKYTLKEAGSVTLAVYDLSGRLISELVNTRQAEGLHYVKFNAAGLSSGVYLYRLQTSKSIEVRKMTLLK